MINLENENYDASWGPSSPAMYLNRTLRPQGQLLTQYYGIGHASLDNYIAQISGQAPNPQTQADCPNYTEFAATGTGAYGQVLGQGCVYPASVKTIGDQLRAAGKTWKAYQEDIANSATEPKTCRHPGDRRGRPDDRRDERPTCTRRGTTRGCTSTRSSTRRRARPRSSGSTRSTTDLASAATTPNLSYITPNVCDDGHDSPCKDGRPGGLTSADAFLKAWVPKILASPAFKADGMLVITFDEADSGKTDDTTACCHTPADPEQRAARASAARAAVASARS